MRVRVQEIPSAEVRANNSPFKLSLSKHTYDKDGSGVKVPITENSDDDRNEQKLTDEYHLAKIEPRKFNSKSNISGRLESIGFVGQSRGSSNQEFLISAMNKINRNDVISQTSIMSQSRAL